MNLDIRNNLEDEEIADIVVSSLEKQLSLGKRVVFFVCGGSSIPLEVLISHKIKDVPEDKLVVSLTDERYGEIGHSESCFAKLTNLGFEIKGAKIIPFLNGKDIINNTEDIIKILDEEFKKVDYKIGIFGVGADGHTAGILPHTPAVEAPYTVYTYDAPPYTRMTLTPKTIATFDEAFIYTKGKDKFPIIEKLKLDDIKLEDQPSQILKSIPKLTIFTSNN